MADKFNEVKAGDRLYPRKDGVVPGWGHGVIHKSNFPDGLTVEKSGRKEDVCGEISWVKFKEVISGIYFLEDFTNEPLTTPD